MKARIKPDNNFGGVYTDEWLEANAQLIVNGQLVSDWTLTEILPAQNLVKPLWNGQSWIEGYSDDDIRAEMLQQIESQRLEVLNRLNEKLILDKAQELDDAEALENSVIYPFWEAGIEVKLNDKYQFFVGTELQLFKVVQAHTTQADWTPTQVPALFTRVQLGDVILDWVQPTGAQDAYRLGDRVIYPSGSGQVWENTGSDANVWQPGVFGWTLI